ncbi:MAG: hypothetical protein GXP27_05940 [Planctomycetes bacterium]|nr:hypothetical protein [Planctomycetota bacterium]
MTVEEEVAPSEEAAVTGSSEMATEVPASVVEQLRKTYEERQRELLKRLRSDPAWRPSHKQIQIIKAGAGLTTFCLDQEGNIVAACQSADGRGPQVRLLRSTGSFVRSWSIPVEPQSVCVAPDGTIFVGGEGQIVKIAPGKAPKVLMETPAMREVRKMTEGGENKSEPSEGKQGPSSGNKRDVQQKTTASGDRSHQNSSNATKDVDKSDIGVRQEGESERQERKIEPAQDEEEELLLDAIEILDEEPRESPLQTFLKSLFGYPPRRVQVDRQELLRAQAQEVNAVAATDRYLFIVGPSLKGYTFAVWKVDRQTGTAERIIDRLSGCCGQMDAIVHDGHIWIPENGRHRVLKYDFDGKRLAFFGKRERKAPDGFGGCCEPKNLCFGPNGDVYTAESGPPVVVKRFSPTGQFRGVVALPEFRVDCVRVPVAASPDGGRLYLLNPGEHQIHVFVPATEAASQTTAAREERPRMTSGGEEAEVRSPVKVADSGPSRREPRAVNHRRPRSDKKVPTTHKQVAMIALPSEGGMKTIHTFCLSRDGRFLAACGGEELKYSVIPGGGLELQSVQEPAGIRVLSPSGRLIATWPLEMTPQAIGVAEDGTIYVGGRGRLAKLDSNGRVLRTVEAPHIAELEPMPSAPDEDKDKTPKLTPEEKRARAARMRELSKELMKVQRALRAMSNKVREEQSRGRLTGELARNYREVIDRYRKLTEELSKLRPSPRRSAALRNFYAAFRKRAVTGIAVTARDVFVACPSTKGYGYDVWRLDRDLNNPKRIITGLRGCCGQMDIQARDDELFVAENARMRVVRYDREGKLLHVWGKKDRTGVIGFGSCCNPMNIRFGPGGYLYTSEASLGRIKRYTPDGQFVDVVAIADLVPGCKHVAIDVSPDGRRVYMLDITRRHVIVFERKVGGRRGPGG